MERYSHEWYLNEERCRNCGLKAITPEQRLLADVLVKCEYPNSYNDDTLGIAINRAKESMEHNGHNFVTGKTYYNAKAVSGLLPEDWIVDSLTDWDSGYAEVSV